MNSRWILLVSFILLLVLAAGCTVTPEQLEILQRNVDYWATQSAAIAAQSAAAQATAIPAMAEERATPEPESAEITALAEAEAISSPATGTLEEITATLAITESVAPSGEMTATVAITESLAAGDPITPAVEIVPTSPATETLTAGPEDEIEPAVEAPVALAVVRNQRVNVRGGPGTEFDVLATVPQNTELEVIGSNQDRSWWRVCCVNEDQLGWVSDSVVAISGDLASLPVIGPLMPDDLQASWAILWECKAEGCAQDQCLGNSNAQALRVRNNRWLEVKREATWEDNCGEAENWLVQVDRYTGQEQRVPTNPPLFYVWEGANPGEETRQLEHLERTLSLWCTGTRVRDVDQGDGWSVLFEGEACYDRMSGILVTLQYMKRWLYTGTFGGQTYERQYFGDYEVYQQVLTETNAPLTGD